MKAFLFGFGGIILKRAALCVPAVAALILFAVLPLFIMLLFSLQGENGAFTLENYIRFFEKGFYLRLTWDTIWLSLRVTLICLLVAYPVAYVMARVIKKHRNTLLLLIIIPFFTSQLVRVFSWLGFLRDGGVLHQCLAALGLAPPGTLGVLFTDTAVIIGLVHIFLPYMVICLYLTLEKIDPRLLEASRSLGAAFPATFFRVLLPLSRPGIVNGCILVFVPCLGSFIEPRILGGVNGTVIGTVIEDQFFAIYGWNFGAASAFILLTLVLLSMALLSGFAREAKP